MEEDPRSSKSNGDQPLFIFIGEYISPSEIRIHDSPTFYDALQLSRKKPIPNKENSSYQYLNLQRNKKIRFHYLDGNIKKSGKISLNKKNLQIMMEQPLNSFFAYLLIKEDRKLSFLTFQPNNKIRKRKKDISMGQSETKETNWDQ